MGKSLTCFGKFLMLLGQILIVVNGQILKSILVWSHRPTPSFKEVNRIGKFIHILVWPKYFLNDFIDGLFDHHASAAASYLLEGKMSL